MTDKKFSAKLEQSGKYASVANRNGSCEYEDIIDRRLGDRRETHCSICFKDDNRISYRRIEDQ